MSSFLSQYFIFISILWIHILTSEVLTPTQHDSNGITLTTNEVTTNVNNEWNITIKTQKTFQFIIELDKTWGFLPNIQSSIRITINSPSIATDTQRFDDLVFGFATNDEQYFSIWIPMDNNGQKNRIYPYCDTSPAPTQSFAVGNITKSLTKDRTCDIAGGSCSNWSTMRPKNAQHPNVFEYNGFPITFTLENNPITNAFYVSFDTALFSESFVQKCGFVAFPTNEGLNIYIGGKDIGQSFIISSFVIESLYNASDDSSDSMPIVTDSVFLLPSIINVNYDTDGPMDPDIETQHSQKINMGLMIGGIAGLFVLGIAGSSLYILICSNNEDKKDAVMVMDVEGDITDMVEGELLTEEGVVNDVRWHNMNKFSTGMVTPKGDEALQDIVCEQEPIPSTHHYE